jgi:hypothetical protein
VPDQRLEKIAKIIKPKKITPTVIEFVDIAGLVKNAHQGEGLGNQFLARIQEIDAICHVVRDFTNEEITHVEGKIDPDRDIGIVNNELSKKNLLTTKPMIYVFNTSKHSPKDQISSIYLDLKEELELSELSEQELKELNLAPKLPKLIKLAYQALDLITFYTVVGNQETKAWTLKNSSSILEAADKVHGDFKEKFIKAEVINWQKLIKAGKWQTARAQGLLRIEGKEYLVQDGDLIEFKI